MKRKDYKFGQEAREAILKVATTIGDTLGKTLGPAGRNFQTSYGITNDGRSILEHMRFEDECEDNVALAFHEVANRTDQDAGDGTTTATVIAAKLAQTVIPMIPDLDAPIPGSQSVMDISRQLEEEKNAAIKALEALAKPVETLDELKQVAFTSMEDKEVASLIAETVWKAGKDSFTAIDEGFSGKIETDVQAGVEMPLQVAAPFMYNQQNLAVYEGSVPVLVANHLFQEYQEITRFLQTMLDFSKENKVNFPAIVIVGKQFSIPFTQAVSRVFKGSNGAINILLLSNTHLSDDLFEDLAAFCDAKCIDTNPKGTKKITDAVFKDCGLVSKVTATPKGAVFYGGKGTTLTTGETTRVQARIMDIKANLAKESDAKKREALERRIAEFQGGKATIYVDAKTAAEKYYLKLKVQDCVNSCKTALEGGILVGGGLSLKDVALQMSPDSLLAPALLEPHRRIQQNAGGSLEIGEDVRDSFLVAKAGVENAVSVIKTVITLEGIIADTPQSLVDDLQRVLLSGGTN